MLYYYQIFQTNRSLEVLEGWVAVSFFTLLGMVTASHFIRACGSTHGQALEPLGPLLPHHSCLYSLLETSPITFLL